MKGIRVLAFVVTVAVLGAGARPAAADGNDPAKNILIGALIGAGIGLVIGIIVYVARPKPPQPSAATRNPASWAAVGLGPLPLAPTPTARAAPAPTAGTLLTF
jgi:hypothetical protein